MKALDKIRQTKEILEKYGVENSVREAELIVSHCMNLDRVILYRDDPPIPEEIDSKIDELLKRRIKREPIQYLLGYTEFHNLKIKVGKGVLIPRPETELLVEEAIKEIKRLKSSRKSRLNILDLCTGSGCIALAIAKEFPEDSVYGIDNSEIALEYAFENASLNNIKNVTFVRGSLFEPLSQLKFDLIVSNPPYIKRKDLINLQPEIKDWEPLDALDGGEDGLDYYRIIVPQAKNFLENNGILMLEIGISQSDSIKKFVEETGYLEIRLVKDYANVERILIAKYGYNN